MQIKLADGTNKTLGIIDLAKFIKEMLLDKPNKSQNFRSLATNIGAEDFIKFAGYIDKQKLWAKKKRLEIIKKETETLEVEIKLEEEKTKTKTKTTKKK